jgi:hypothetical protein
MEWKSRSQLRQRSAAMAVVHMPTGAPGDLGEFRCRQVARRPSVEFAQARKGDMDQIHVQAHADGVGRHQIIHLARLIHLDLGVAGARAQRAHDNGTAAALAAHHLGDAIDLGGGKSHHRTARGQSGGLARPAVAQCRKPRAGDDIQPGQQSAQERPHGVGPQQHGLVHAAGMQDTIGEDMAALGIGRHLDFVDGKEAHRPVQRHGFDGADEVLGARRDDLFLAGHQGDGPLALDFADAIVVFAGQQAQRKADHAAGMAQHALDREIGLAGVGRAEYGRQPGARGADHQSNIVERACDCKSGGLLDAQRLCPYIREGLCRGLSEG